MAARKAIRFIKALDVKFGTMDNTATGACEFFRQMQAGKTRAINPKAVVSYTAIPDNVAPPTINVHFINDRKETLIVPSKNVKEIFEEIDLLCAQVETEYEEAGKSID